MNENMLNDNELDKVSGGYTALKIEEKLVEIIERRLAVRDLQKIVGCQSLIDDLGADSLDVVDIVSSAEEQFNVTIPESEFIRIGSVQDLTDLVSRMIREQL